MSSKYEEGGCCCWRCGFPRGTTRCRATPSGRREDERGQGIALAVLVTPDVGHGPAAMLVRVSWDRVTMPLRWTS
jgi:hypothetical protein